jgi:hypothetical protein
MQPQIFPKSRLWEELGYLKTNWLIQTNKNRPKNQNFKGVDLEIDIKHKLTGQQKLNPNRKRTTHVQYNIGCLYFVPIWNCSRNAQVNVSTIANCESKPNVYSIRKNRIEKNGPTGICDKASGYIILFCKKDIS